MTWFGPKGVGIGSQHVVWLNDRELLVLSLGIGALGEGGVTGGTEVYGQKVQVLPVFDNETQTWDVELQEGAKALLGVDEVNYNLPIITRVQQASTGEILVSIDEGGVPA